MSNLPSSPGNRPLDQLKVAELREELRKRGLSLKGVKKELCERLEEAINQEQRGGPVHEESQKDVTETDTTGVKGDDGMLDDREEAPNVKAPSETMELERVPLSRSDPLTVSVPVNERTNTSQGLPLPAVSAPDGVHGVSEAREQCNTAGDLKSYNNSVLFVDDAASENGDSALPSESVHNKDINIVDASEEAISAANAVSDMGHEVNHGKLPNSVMPEVLDEKNIAAVHAECGMNDTEVSPLVSAENAETQGRAGNKVSVMVYGVNALGCSEGQKSSETVLPESSLQIPREGGATSPSSDTVTPENDLKPSELPEPDVGDLNHNEQGALTHEVKPNVQLGFQRKHGDININGMAKTDADVLVGTDVKLNKHSEDGRALEEKVKHEMVSANSIQEVNIYGNDNILKSEGEDNNSGYSAQMSEGAKKDIDMKLVDDSFPSDVQTKRGNEFKVQEPAKRMRRWNAGNHATADTLKPVTSGSVEDIVLPENKNGSCSPSPKPTAKGEMAPRLLPGISDSSSGLPKRTTPKVVATTRSLPPLVKVESCESKRIVPPSKRTPSNTLKVDGFVRPFTLKSLQDTLASFGKFSYFWMDDIKTHCYVSYPSVNDAVAARNWLFGRQWPPIVGNFLSADFVDPNELKIRIEGLSEKPQAGSALALTRVPDPMPAPSRPDHSQSFPTNSTASSMSLPPLEQRLCPPPEPPMPTLEDLFLKTKAKPHIYYLPLTDEQVAERLKNK